MKPPVEMMKATDYVQPSSEKLSLKSPLELLANACNKLETDMMSSAKTAPSSRSSPPSDRHSPPSSHLPLRLPPTRLPSEAVSRHPKPSSLSPSSNRSSVSPGFSPPPPHNSAPQPSAPQHSVPRPRDSPQNLSRRPSPAPPAPTRSPHLPPTSQSPLSMPPRLPASFPPTSMASLAMALGYPPSSLAGLSPYSPYSPYLGLPGMPGPPPPSSAPCTDPMCRDPSCPTYAMRLAQAQLMAASSMGMQLPPGYPSPYASLSPYSLPGMMPPSLLPPSLPPHLLPPTTTAAPPSSSPTSAAIGSSPYMCSWMQGRDFCGRRFNSSEELMAHLRSHTANMGEAPAQPAAPPATAPHSALAMLQAQAAQMRGQPSPTSSAYLPATSSAPTTTSSGSDSPSSRYLEAAAAAASRYHPYGRPAPPSHLPPGAGLPPHLLSSLYGSPRPSLPVLP